jgi:SAM-dependent methyltransferase
VTDWGVGRYERTAEQLLPAARVLVDSASLRTGERVLDLGCGTGNAALLAAAAGAHVTAVDPSLRLLGVASSAAEREGLELSCEAGDAESIPAADGTFDCVLSNFGLIFASDPDAAVEELARAATPDGRVAFTAWLPGGALGALASAAEELVRSAVGAPPAAPGFSWHDGTEVQALFSRHGMETSVQGPHELVTTAASPEAYLEAEMANHPMAVAADGVFRARGVSEEARRRLLDVLREHNEDEDAFRSTSRYVVIVATRS